MWGKKKNLAQKIIEPDEIFMDSANLPGYERGLFEGRIESPLPSRVTYAIFVIFILGSVFITAQLINLQILKHGEYLARAENNKLARIRLPAERGLIYDRNMKELAWNTDSGRDYWRSAGLAHAVGYVGYAENISEDVNPQTKVGRAGIEKAYDEFLRGVDGSRLIEETASGEILSESVELEIKNGASVVLTIDAEMQSKLFSIIKSVARDRGFNAGSGIIIDVLSGEILAASSFPEFDSKILSRNSSPAEIASYLTSENKPFFFRAFEGLYAPGSIFKTIVALGAIGEKIIDPERQILSTGSISIPNPYFPDQPSFFYDWKAHGWVDMRRALAVSSNVYFYTVGGGFGDQEGLGVKKITDYSRRMGLGGKVGAELAESEGFLPTPEWKEKNNQTDPVWRVGDTYNLSIGQGMVQVTPLQMAQVAAIIAREGIKPDIHMVKSLLFQDGSEMKTETEPNQKIDIPSEAFTVVKEGMRQAAEYGTASALSGLGVEVAGKTGTAELGTEKKKVNSWFMGFLPYKNPKIALVIVLEAGSSKNLVGAPYAAREMVSWIVYNRKELVSDL